MVASVHNNGLNGLNRAQEIYREAAKDAKEILLGF
jgi:hypothetical protein